MKRSLPTMAMMATAMAMVVALPLVAWALMAGGPAPDPTGVSQVVTVQDSPQPWLMMAMGVGFLAVSGWQRWQEKHQGK
jgi:hypothetical protein